MKNFYNIGKNGSYDDICKHYGPDSEKDILKGLKDRKDRKDVLIKLYHKFDGVFYVVCLLGIKCFVDYILDTNTNTFKIAMLNIGIQRACEGGHRDIVDLMIQKGANNWNWGLHGACYGGHMNLIDLMIQKGANDFNWGLQGACNDGHLGIVKYMVEKGANKYNEAFDNALSHKHWTIVEYLVSIGVIGIVPKKYTDYYEYLLHKLIKAKGNVHDFYYELNYLVSMY